MKDGILVKRFACSAFSIVSFGCSLTSLKPILKVSIVVSLLSVFLLPSVLFAQSKGSSQKNTSPILVTADYSGKVLRSNSNKEHYVPASIIKIATASYALFTFGENHTFSTYFHETPSGDLVIRGAGDPGFTSKDLAFACAEIARKRKSFNRIIFDTTFYADELKVPGRGASNNPYDAPIGALAINYNTVSIQKRKDGSILSGEQETPLTSFAKKIAQKLPSGSHRVRVGNDHIDGLQQLHELTKIFLSKHGVKVGSEYLIKKTPPDSKLIYTHESSKILKEHVKDMLFYSNNFIANQLFYVTSAYYSGPPARFALAKKNFEKFLSKEIGFEGSFEIEEGAGLSRNNRMTISQGIKMLRYFYPYRDLLSQEKSIFYKSGTLTGVSNLAGYLDGDIRRGDPVFFLYFDTKVRAITDRVNWVKREIIR